MEDNEPRRIVRDRNGEDARKGKLIGTEKYGD
jgi:hypothetical protein